MTESKVVLVTGAAKRIGASIARTFHSNGYKILIHAKNSMLEAKNLCSEFNRVKKIQQLLFVLISTPRVKQLN